MVNDHADDGFRVVNDCADDGFRVVNDHAETVFRVVNDHKNGEYLGEFAAKKENTLAWLSGPQVGWFDEKKRT